MYNPVISPSIAQNTNFQLLGQFKRFDVAQKDTLLEEN
jgi:hypothetical protein